MARGKLLHKSVPRAELDHRARDARNRLVQVERLLVPRAMMLGSWLSPSVFSAHAQAAAAEATPGSAGRKPIRASAVIQTAVRPADLKHRH